MSHLLLLAFFLSPLTSAQSQDQSPPKQVQDLGWMVGTWTGSGKISFGGHSVGIDSTMVVSFDGQFLKAVSTDKSADSTLTKTTMTGWEPAKSRYISYTFTNMAPTARIAHGTADGSKLQMISDPWEAEGMTTVSRETVSKLSDSKCNFILEFKKGDNWIKAMDFVLAK